MLGAALLGWCLISAAAGLQTAVSRPTDPMGQLDAEFRWFNPYLPPYAIVGYLEPYKGAGSDDAIRMHYAAQYSLVPRVVVSRVGPEYLIVAHGTAQPDKDSRLAGFSPVATFPMGDRLYRRSP